MTRHLGQLLVLRSVLVREYQRENAKITCGLLDVERCRNNTTCRMQGMALPLQLTFWQSVAITAFLDVYCQADSNQKKIEFSSTKMNTFQVTALIILRYSFASRQLVCLSFVSTILLMTSSTSPQKTQVPSKG